MMREAWKTLNDQSCRVSPSPLPNKSLQLPKRPDALIERKGGNGPLRS
jgi:hypothetical protein